jgi:hypothetical protein
VDLGGHVLLGRNSTDSFIPRSPESVGEPRGFHREDAKSAKKGDELAHNPLTIRFMPSFGLFIVFSLRVLRVFAVLK